MKIILITLLVTIVLSQNRISIDVYTESLCPDCISFLGNSLTEAVNTPDID